METENLWRPQLEKRFIQNTDAIVYADITCENCDYNYQALFKKSKPSVCPKCGGNLRSSTPQGRNAPVANYTEKFFLNLVKEAIENQDRDNIEAKR